MKPRCSVVIPTRNRARQLTSTLAALSRQTLPYAAFEILVVDDGSTSSQRPALDCLHPHIRQRYIRSPHLGPAHARNLGVAVATGDVIVFIDDDVIVTANCLLAHVTFHEQNDAIAWGHTIIASEPVDLRLFPNPFGFPRPQRQAANMVDKQELPWDHFMTCNLSLRKADFESVGGFDSAFVFANYEDMELGYRLHKQGHRLLVNARARACHFHYRNFHERARWAAKNGMSRFFMWRLHPELHDRLLVDRTYSPGTNTYLLNHPLMSRQNEIRAFRKAQQAEHMMVNGAWSRGYDQYAALMARQFLYYESLGAIWASHGFTRVSASTPWRLAVVDSRNTHGAMIGGAPSDSQQTGARQQHPSLIR